MPRKKQKEELFYTHPTAGNLPLVPHPTLEGRVVAYLDGRAVFETGLDRARLLRPDLGQTVEPGLEPEALP